MLDDTDGLMVRRERRDGSVPTFERDLKADVRRAKASFAPAPELEPEDHPGDDTDWWRILSAVAGALALVGLYLALAR